MPITNTSKLSHMNITTKELLEKHQLNPHNNGLSRLDDAIFFNTVSNKWGICALTRISIFSEEYPLLVSTTNQDRFIISQNTKLLCENGEYINFAEGKLNLATKLINIDTNSTNKRTTYAITELKILDKLCPMILIRTDRDNYVLDNGFIVKRD